LNANSTHTISVANSGAVDGETATLTINYGAIEQIIIALEGTIENQNGVVSFTMVDADIDIDLFDLVDGIQIDIDNIQGIGLNIRANTNPTTVGSVSLSLSGPVNNTRTENAYALFGDSNGNYSGAVLLLGDYIISATAYSGSGQGGTTLGTLALQFSIVTTGGSNIPPNVTNPGSQNNNEGDLISLQIQVTDENTNLTYAATGLPPTLNIDPNTGLISGTILEGTSNAFLEQNGLVIIEAESGTLVPIWTATATDGVIGIIAGSNNFGNQNGGTIPYQINISTPGVYRFQWRNFYSGSNPTEENDNWLRFPNSNGVWFFGYQGTPANEAALIGELEGAQNNIVFPVGSGRESAGTIPDGSSSNGYFKIFRQGGASEVYDWQAFTSDNDNHDIYVRFENAGVYTMEISERSAGHAIDRIALYKVDGQNYTNAELTALPESQTSGGSGAAANSPYNVEITVTDDGVPPLDTQIQFIWNVGDGSNLPPVAIATAIPLTGDAPLQVNFTGSNSTDDVGIVSYLWDFMDNGNTSTEADPAYTFTDVGTYIVELTVTDGGGLTDTTTVTIIVNDPAGNQPPVAVRLNRATLLWK